MTADTPLVIYGLGSTGKRIVDELLDAGVAIDLILDRGKQGETYRDVAIESLETVDPAALSGRSALIALHNHYVDMHEVDRGLREAGVARVMTPIALGEYLENPASQAGYWLDGSFDYDGHRAVLKGFVPSLLTTAARKSSTRCYAIGGTATLPTARRRASRTNIPLPTSLALPNRFDSSIAGPSPGWRSTSS